MNNLTGTKALSTNCEPDKSVALLNNIHDLIQEYDSNTIKNVTETEKNDLFNDIICDPQFSKRENNFFENESLSSTSNLICAKILIETFCGDCRSMLQDNLDDSALCEDHSVDPSLNFKSKCMKIFKFAMQVIPHFCSEKFVSKIVIEEVKKLCDEEVETEIELGCDVHAQEVTDKLYISTIDYALFIFCQNINDILTGKVKGRPLEPNIIQDLAWTFYVTNRKIKKHSDIFKINKSK